MNDMSAVIVPKSDQLNSDDLIAGPRTIRIRDVTIRPGTEQPVSIFFDGDNNKPWKPCKSASRVLVAAWGPDANVYRGRSATIYRDDGVTWGGMKVGGIRISALSDLTQPLVMALTEKKGSKKIATIQPLKVDAAPAQTGRQTAEQWTDQHLALIDAQQDVEGLAAVQNAGKKALDKLATSKPALHQQIVEAYAAKLADLNNPTAHEGRSDEDHGDGFTDDRITDDLLEANR